ncbi:MULTISPECIES: STAS domain-containing protein [Deinococcus]|uniref:Anti-sigma factor antagonist n=1 Tax=Deinococcus rufus TaxID=2136097 RepID=A0ABV7Z4V0_9DEIO|nr:STAS domain-containing protein [Deinococcus sp. AB2017081]WQE95532.1 STAS domain-containing protein [Deinococcus sp. AB2017081]
MNITDPQPRADGHALHVSGRLDAQTAATFRSTLQAHLAGHTGHLYLNLADVSFMDSSALAGVVATLKALRARGDELRLTGAGPAVRELLSLTLLDRVLPLREDLA